MSRTRKGVVYIAPVDQVPADGSMVSPDSRFSASWQSNEEGLLEDCPECANADEAIAWGRARAATVLIRLGHRSDTYFSAGEAHPRRADPPLPAWPPAGPPPEGWWTLEGELERKKGKRGIQLVTAEPEPRAVSWIAAESAEQARTSYETLRRQGAWVRLIEDGRVIAESRRAD